MQILNGLPFLLFGYGRREENILGKAWHVLKIHHKLKNELLGLSVD